MAPCHSASIPPASKPSLNAAGSPLTTWISMPAASHAVRRNVSAGPRAGPAPTRLPASWAKPVMPLLVSAATWKAVSYIGNNARTAPCRRPPAAGVPASASCTLPRKAVPMAPGSSSTKPRFCSEPVLVRASAAMPAPRRKPASPSA